MMTNSLMLVLSKSLEYIIIKQQIKQWIVIPLKNHAFLESRRAFTENVPTQYVI